MQFKVNKCGLLVAMCIKKDVFINMMNDYPEAR